MSIAAAQPPLQSRQRSVSRRAGLLVAISGPYSDRINANVSRLPLGGLLVAGATTSFRMAMTTGPMEAVERRLNAHGPAIGPEEVARRRRIKVAGSLATIAAGVLAQRTLTHSGRTGPGIEVGRTLGSQLAIGGAANALVLAADAVLRTDQAAQLSRRGQAATVGTVVVLAQRRILNRSAARLTLPMPPASTTIPLAGRWRTRSVELPLR